MLKQLILIGCMFLAVNAIEYTLENCKCHTEYKATKDASGKVQCEGIKLLAIMPCNLPQAPKCECTEDKPTGIMSDKDGTWCTIKENGELKKKWACENKEAWETYRQELEEYQKTVGQ